MKKLLLIPLALVLALGGFLVFHETEQSEEISIVQQQLQHTGDVLFGAADTILPAGLSTYTLAGSGISSSATSITLTSLTLPQNGYEIQDSDLSATFHVTIEPGNTSRQEFVSCTTVTQGAGTTATLSGCTRGLSPITPFTASSTLQFSHAGGTKLIFSNSPQLYNQFYALGNVATSTNILIFSSTTPPRLDFPGAQSTGTYIATTSELASIAYVNAISIASASNATESVKGIVELATALEAASSTILGSTGAGLVLQSQFATDTPQYGCAVGYTGTAGAGCTILASLGGKLKQAWLDLTADWTFAGGGTATTTYNRGVYVKATTTMPFVISDIFTSWDFGASAVGKFLKIVSGSGTGASPYVFTPISITEAFATSTTQVTSSSNTASTTVFSVTVPANTLSTGNSIVIDIPFSSFAVSSGNMWLDLAYGTGSTTQTLAGVANLTGQRGTMQIILQGSGATNSQKATMSFVAMPTGTFAAANAIGVAFTKLGSFSQDSTTALKFMLVIRFDTSDAGSSFTIDQMVGRINR